jgi:hypothetical protein
MTRFKKEWTIPVSIGVGSFLAGVGVGIFVGRKIRFKNLEERVSTLQDFINERKEEQQETIEIIESKEVIMDDNHPGKRIMEKFNQDLAKLNEYQENTPIEVQYEDAVERQEAFAPDDEDWSYEEEVKNRDENHPYVLHRDEFFGNEMADEGYSQTTITYYASDNVLTDEGDMPIYNYENITGPLLFGHGSQDISIVYIRNDKLMHEWEILLEPGYYQVEVLGADIEGGWEAPKLDKPWRERPE